MKKTKKILIVAYLILIITTMCNMVYGADFDTNAYKPARTRTADNVGQLETIGNYIVGVIRTTGAIVSIAVLIVVGIKYMSGSLEEKAEYKQTMIAYIIGAVLTFGITQVLAFIIDITELF